MSVGSLKLGKEGIISLLCEVECAPSSELGADSLVVVENVLGGLWSVGRFSTEGVLGNVLDEFLAFSWRSAYSSLLPPMWPPQM